MEDALITPYLYVAVPYNNPTHSILTCQIDNHCSIRPSNIYIYIYVCVCQILIMVLYHITPLVPYKLSDSMNSVSFPQDFVIYDKVGERPGILLY